MGELLPPDEIKCMLGAQIVDRVFCTICAVGNGRAAGETAR